MLENMNIPFVISLFVILFLLLWLYYVYKYIKDRKIIDDDITEIVKPFDPNFKYKDNVYLIKGRNFCINDETITIRGFKPELKENDMVIGDESPGFLRLITGIKIYNKSRVLTTKKVEISDIIQTGKLSSLYSIAPSKNTNANVKLGSLQKQDKKPILFKAYNKTQQLRNLQAYNFIIKEKISTSYNMPFNNSFELAKISDKLQGNLKVFGNLKIKPTLAVNIDIGWTGVDEFTLMLYIDIESSIGEEINVICKDLVNKDWNLNFILGRWIIPICVGVWIEITPQIKVGFKINISASLAIKTQVSYNTTKPYAIGITYKDDKPLKLISQTGDFRKVVIPGIDLNSGEMSVILEPYIDLSLNFLLWGFIGPYIQLYFYYQWSKKTEIKPNPQYPNYQIVTNTLKNILGFRIYLGGRLFSKRISVKLYDKEWIL